MESLLIVLVFALLVILIVTVIAFRSAKPTTINNGIIHNHYYGQEKPKPIIDEDTLLIARSVGELLREVRGDGKDGQSSGSRTLTK
jgi:hypothetical protein